LSRSRPHALIRGHLAAGAVSPQAMNTFHLTTIDDRSDFRREGDQALAGIVHKKRGHGRFPRHCDRSRRHRPGTAHLFRGKCP
jgi:hypothetical protein